VTRTNLKDSKGRRQPTYCVLRSGPPAFAFIEFAEAEGASRAIVSRPFPSWNRSILTEIYLCHACSCQEIFRTETAGQEHANWPGVELDGWQLRVVPRRSTGHHSAPVTRQRVGSGGGGGGEI
jgi:hypothetical protein